MRIFKRTIFTLLIILVVAIFGGYLFIKFKLPDTGAAPDIKVDMSQASLERGKYLVTNVSACNVCHSKLDPSKFGLPIIESSMYGGGQIFDEKDGVPGRIVASNITPYKLKTWTDGEIFRAISSGVSKDGHALFPLMPYHNYGHLSEDDIKSIVAYLRTVPEVKNDPQTTELNFPVSLLVNTFPVKPSFQKIPDTTDKVAYGKYIITASACMHCHSKDVKGSIPAGAEYAGGKEFIMPNGKVNSSNITPDKQTGIGNWTEEMFVRKFQQYDTSFIPYNVTKKINNGFNSPMPWLVYGKMKAVDIKAIYAYLQSLKPVKNSVIKYTPSSN